MSNDNGTSTEGRQTIVEEGSEFSGKLNSKVDILARGRIEGELTAPSLTVSPSGAVHGKVRVTSLNSEGELSGDIEADTVRLAGAVRDSTVVRAKTLEVRLLGETGREKVVFGECELQIGDAPEDEKGTAKKSTNPKKGRRGNNDAATPDVAARPDAEA